VIVEAVRPQSCRVPGVASSSVGFHSALCRCLDGRVRMRCSLPACGQTFGKAKYLLLAHRCGNPFPCCYETELVRHGSQPRAYLDAPSQPICIQYGRMASSPLSATTPPACSEQLVLPEHAASSCTAETTASPLVRKTAGQAVGSSRREAGASGEMPERGTRPSMCALRTQWEPREPLSLSLSLSLATSSLAIYSSRRLSTSLPIALANNRLRPTDTTGQLAEWLG